MYGVHFIVEEGMESILVIFLLKTNDSERIIAAILPLPFNTIDDIIDKLNRRFLKDKRLIIKCSAFASEAEYFSEIGYMKP